MAKKLTTEQFIKNAKKKHGDKYDYSKTKYNGMKNKVEIICKTHGLFLCNPSDHTINGSGCPKCSGSGYYVNPLEYFIERANIIHDNKYDYSKFDYKTAKIKSIIICPIHGEFSQHANNHLNKQGCPKCRGTNISKTRTKNNTDKDIFNKLKIIHNNKYEYPIQPPINRHSGGKIDIICPIHGEFTQGFLNHYYRGCGCEKCGNNRMSKGEKRIEEFLIENKIPHIREHSFEQCTNPETGKKLFFDFFLPTYNTCVEYHGKQHFEESEFFKLRSGDLKELQKRDKIKKQYCLDNNINLIIIPYKKYYNIYNELNKLI